MQKTANYNLNKPEGTDVVDISKFNENADIVDDELKKRALITQVTEAQSAAQSYADSKISNLVNSAPAALDTLKELADALGDDPNFRTTILNAIATKLNSSAYTAADVLAKLKTVDGAGSGLDVDLLDGKDSTAFALNNDYVHVPGYAIATGSANAYVVSTTPAPTAYVDGMCIVVKINVASTGASTLNWNSLGAKAILDSLGNAITAGGLKAGLPYAFRYNGTSFIVQGKGGDYGTATQADVLSTKTFGTEQGVKQGTMPNNGALSYTPSGSSQPIPAGYTSGGSVSAVTVPVSNVLTGTTIAGQAGTMPNRGAVTLTPGTTDQTISNGYHNGSGKIKGDPNLITGNIRAEATIFGVDGKSTVVDTEDATGVAADVRAGKTVYIEGIKVTGTKPVQATSGQTVTPGTSNIVKAAGIYDGAITIKGDTSLASANIKAGSTIFGVAGKSSVVDTADATATAGDIVSGKSGYVNGVKIPGSATIESLGGKVWVSGSVPAVSRDSPTTVTLPFLPSAITITFRNFTDGTNSAYMYGVAALIKNPTNGAYYSTSYDFGSGYGILYLTLDTTTKVLTIYKPAGSAYVPEPVDNIVYTAFK